MASPETARLYPLTRELVSGYAETGDVPTGEEKDLHAQTVLTDDLSRPAGPGGCKDSSPPLYHRPGAAPVPVYSHFFRRFFETAGEVVCPQGHLCGMCPDQQRLWIYQL